MLLSPNQTKPPDKGNNPNNSARSTSPTSTSRRNSSVPYSKVHQRPAVTLESATITSDATAPVIIETAYWRVSQSPGSIFFDVTSRHESDREVYKLAYYQFKDYVGLVVHKSGPNRYLEINFDNEEFRTTACNHDLQFDKGMIIIRPVIAYRPGSIVKRVTLQRLPWLRPQRLLEGLRNTSSSYGIVHDVGIVTDTETGAFLGSGYAILDCSSDPDQTDPFLELTHVIQWVDPDSNVELSSSFIHAYWKDMATYCKYCHELGHSAVDCKEAPSNKRKCFYCYKAGHICSQCPEKVALGKRRKGASSASTTAVTTQPSQVSPSFTVDSAITMTAKEPVHIEPSQKESPSSYEIAPVETETDSPASQTDSTTNASTVSILDSIAHHSKYATPNIEVATTAPISMIIDDEPSPASPEPAISECSFSTTELMDTNSPFEDAILSPASNGENNSLSISNDKPTSKLSTTATVRKPSRTPKPRTLMNL
ncbi:hypothetical protein G6F43_007331 [Rhizopus delemar]|nr:hypothetical protein G6F43_007331 [Rhizopus delemar]